MVHQQRLHDLGEGFHRAGGHAADHAVEVFGRGRAALAAAATGLRGRFLGQLQAASQHAQHGMVRLDGGRGRQFVGGEAIQFVPLAPSGQIEVVLHVARLDRRPLPLIALVQGAAIEVRRRRPARGSRRRGN